jgi:hypothetical protein
MGADGDFITQDFITEDFITKDKGVVHHLRPPQEFLQAKFYSWAKNIHEITVLTRDPTAGRPLHNAKQ